MPRKKKSFDYNDTFPTRLRNLINESKDITQDKVAEIVGVTRQTVGNWCNGDSSPDAAALCKIADIFDVSIDWLMRENAPQKMDVEVSSICKYTGLNAIAIERLHEAANISDRLTACFLNETISKLISSKSIDSFCLSVENYFLAVKDTENTFDSVLDGSLSRQNAIKSEHDARYAQFDVTENIKSFLNETSSIPSLYVLEMKYRISHPKE